MLFKSHLANMYDSAKNANQMAAAVILTNPNVYFVSKGTCGQRQDIGYLGGTDIVAIVKPAGVADFRSKSSGG